MSKVLLVEDDQDISDGILLFLKSSGFETFHVADGDKVVEAARTFAPDLIILDLMLPNKDGLACCQEIREFSNVPIIMLTAKVEQIDKLVGLEAGADDYICKPFDTMELMLRVKAILRRTANQVQFSDVHLIKSELKVTYKNQTVNLSSLEFGLFELLFNTPNRVYSREQIIQQAYPNERDITDRAVDSHVKNIRKKFKAAGAETAIIASVYGAGYRYQDA